MRKRTVAIIMMMIIGVGIGLVYYYISPGLDETCISQQLYADGDNNDYASGMNMVVIPSCLLTESTNIDVVVSDYEQIDLIFYEASDGSLSSWWRGEPHNSLTHFISGEIYYFKVIQDILFVVE